ncbi:hypothetical protein EON65_52295 [archaeon]|nr:MAG: hypothetical protein EON65_52295 [archaeon]
MHHVIIRDINPVLMTRTKPSIPRPGSRICPHGTGMGLPPASTRPAEKHEELIPGLRNQYSKPHVIASPVVRSWLYHISSSA